MTVAEQFIATQKTSIDTLFGLGDKAFEGVEKLTELNLQAAKALIAEAKETALAALSAKEPQELVALQSGWLKPAVEKAAAYSRHVYEIAAATSAEFTRAAEEGVNEAQKSLLSAVETAAKNAPPGSENAVALIKTAVEGANSAYEGIQKAAKQATEVAEANFENMTETAVKSSQAATSKAKRAAEA